MKLSRPMLLAVILLLPAQIGASAALPPGEKSASGNDVNGISQETHGPADKMLGLIVKKENVAGTLQQESRALYVDRVGMYSLRDPNNLLEATLEIARFRSVAPYASNDFRLSVAGAIGSVLPIVIRVGSTPVYITSRKGLTVALWFHGNFMLTLSVRNTYRLPKSLLRAALAINP